MASFALQLSPTCISSNRPNPSFVHPPRAPFFVHCISSSSTSKEKANDTTIQKLTQTDRLVEKYVNPNNSPSTQKTKMNAQQFTDEFRISESDCGSAAVQVVQLTSKLKHLSSVLNKKDYSSRIGLLGMLSQRKKLLRYLRKSDYESYHLIISKLGIRDKL